MKELKYRTTLKDALYNLSPGTGSNTQYNKGLLVGIVSAFMSTGYTFSQACQLVLDNLPQNYDDTAIPESWIDFFTNNKNININSCHNRSL
jgi:hypothetical protein